MLQVYVKLPTETVYDLEEYREHMKDVLRLQVNTLLEHKMLIPSSYSLRILIHKFIEDREGFALVQENKGHKLFYVPVVDQEYTFLMYFDELEDMFRQEFEYWVIRKQKPVSMVKTSDGYFKIVLGHRHDHSRHDNFRDAEKFLRETYIPVERTRIAGSPFNLEDNLITLYKIK